MDDQKNTKHPSILHLKDAPIKDVHKNGGECRVCGQHFAYLNAQGLCENCADYEIYKKVKEYVRAHDNVNEWMVADVFDIPIERVRRWIKEGYLSYKDQKEVTPLEAEKAKIQGVYRDMEKKGSSWRS